MFSKDFDAGQLNPYVRYVHVSFNTAKMHSVPERELYDFGLIFVMEGELTFEYGGDTVVLRENDLHIMPPGLGTKDVYPARMPAAGSEHAFRYGVLSASPELVDP